MSQKLVKREKREKERSHDVLGPCQCKKKCYQKIDYERRLTINDQFWQKTSLFREIG